MKKTLNLSGEILDLSIPKIMGILNATPDSFYIESRVVKGFERVIDQMVAERVDILDIGGYSTRPDASNVSVQEEIDRVLPLVEYVNKNHPNVPLSIDTFRHQIVAEVVKTRDVIVNDVSGGNLDDKMWDFVASKKLPYILMHMRGDPSNMQNERHTKYEDVVVDVIRELQRKVNKLHQMGVMDVVIDPGIGFAKKRLDNFEIIKNLSAFGLLDSPVLIGISRKSLLWKTLDCSPAATLPATCALNALAINSGISILRVHDVAEAVQIRDLMVAGNLI